MGQKGKHAPNGSSLSDIKFKNYLASEENQGNFKGQRRMKCMLAILTLLLGLAVVALIIMAIFLIKYPEELKRSSKAVDDSLSHGDGSSKSQTSKEEVCLTKGCVIAASRIHRYADTSVDPCEDFYQFACGGWEKQNTIEPDENQVTAIRELQAQSRFVVKKVMEKSKTTTDPGYVNKLKDFYSSCVNQDWNRDDFQNLENVIQTRFGGWPLVSNNWNESTFSLEEAVLEASRLGVQTLADFSVIAFVQNKTLNMLRANQPIVFTLGYKEDYRVDRTDPKFSALEDKIVAVAGMFGDINETAAREDAVALVTFEQDLALSSYMRYNAFVNPYVLSKWQLRYSTEVLDWKTFFVLATANPDVGIYDVTEEETIYRGPDAYFTRLKNLLLATPKRTVANFIIWRVIDTYWDLASNNQTDEELNQWETSAAREEACLESVTMENDLKFASSQIFLKEKFSTQDKTMVMNMIPLIKDATKQLMDELEWIDEETLMMTKEKLDYTKEKVGYPESIYNDANLENYYSNVSFTSDNYLKNLFIMKRDSWMKMTRRLRVPNDDDNLWKFLPIQVNAFHDVVVNSIEFPAAIFQRPYFSDQNLKSLNFGGIGSVIGHELTHGFDKTGIQFDKYGTSGSWWNSTAVESFNNQTKCLEEQYNNFVVKEANMSINGKLTLNENIADNAGVRQSFRAYKNWVASQGKEEPALPGLNFTHDQLYFISRAHIYCTLMRKEEAIQFVTYSPHSYGRFRINGPNQNSEDFAKAFNCPLNSNMNPAKKCVLW